MPLFDESIDSVPTTVESVDVNTFFKYKDEICVRTATGFRFDPNGGGKKQYEVFSFKTRSCFMVPAEDVVEPQPEMVIAKRRK